jgi:hypothetical protein
MGRMLPYPVVGFLLDLVGSAGPADCGWTGAVGCGSGQWSVGVASGS